MASPFAVFRKNQKFLIATLGLLAMIAFVFLPMILKGLGGSGPGKDPVVVTSKYGNLTERQLQNMRNRRQAVIQFLQRAVVAAAFDQQSTSVRTTWIGEFFGQASEQSTVDLWLLVQRAKQLGMTISDESLSDFIGTQITENRVTHEQFAHLYKTLNISEDIVFDALQDELLAQELQEAFTSSLGGTTPAQRWEYFQRLNRKVNIQVAAVPVADYVDQVKDPTDDELKAFFEDHKGELVSPLSPKPGFRVPTKAAVEYVKADVSKLLDITPITDKEIEAYYMKNRDERFLKSSLPGLDEDDKKTALPGLDVDKKKAALADAKTAKAKPAAADAKKPLEPKKETPKQETPKQETPKQETPKKDTPSPEAKESSASDSKSPFRLVSVADEKPAEKNAEDKPAENPTEKKAAPKPAEKTAVKKADDKPAKKPGEKKTDSKPVDKKPAAKTAADSKYKPLDAVRSEIRATLTVKKQAAAIKAFGEVEKSLLPIREAITKYRRALSLFDATSDEKGAQKPEAPNFDALAKKNGLTFHKTGLIPAAEMANLDIGRSMIQSGQSFLSSIYTTSNLNRPRIATDIGRNIYMFWKTDSSEEGEPKFDDEGMSATVLAAWKLEKAREIARKEAGELAEQARQSKKPLAEALGADHKVQESGNFSWVTRAPVPGARGRTRLFVSRIDNVEKPGEKFMRAVYDLEVGQIGVAMNLPEDVAYVIQLENTEPSDTVLWIGFQADPYSVYSAVGRSDQDKMIETWIGDIRNDANLKWERKPVPAARRRQR